MLFDSSLLAALIAVIPTVAAAAVPYYPGCTIATPTLAPGKKPPQVTNNPAICPSFVWKDMDAAVAAALPTQTYKATTVTGQGLPSACAYQAAKNTLSPKDFRAVRVQYPDCESNSWVFCIHKDAPDSEEHIFKTFGSMPAGFRTLVQTPIAVNKTYIGAAYTVKNTIVFSGGNWNVGILAHEIGHVADWIGFDNEQHDRNESYFFSGTKLWQDAETVDKGVATSYGQTTWAESFAEVSRAVIYDILVEGGLKKINPKGAADLLHQIQIYEHFLGKKLFPATGKCEYQVKELEWVDINASGFAPLMEDEPPEVKELLEAHRQPYA